MSNQKSLYQCILDGMENGALREGFSLPEPEDGRQIRYADGAMDGIALYHMPRAQMDEAGMDLMSRAVRSAAAGNHEEADLDFARLGKIMRAVSVIDQLQSYIMENADQLPTEEVFQSALYLMVNSTDRESVKFGLSIMELFADVEEEIREIIRTLGLSDEFTIFSVWNMLKWENGNQEIFNLIRKVRGWGRIHALQRLKPETPEISEWILLSGIDNDVMAAYSALPAWTKADVYRRLRKPMSQEEFEAIGRILQALLDEGPVAGISRVLHVSEDIMRYLSLADEFDLGIEEYETIQALQRWAESEEVSQPEIAGRCAEILASEKCRRAMEDV